MAQEGQPFSATYNKLRGKAGGLTIGKSDTEFKDNSFDAKATYSFTKIAKLEGDISGIFIVQVDNGEGCVELPHIYGLARAMPRKTGENTCGLFNHGHTAAIAFHNPESVYSESVHDSKFQSLSFTAGDFSAHIDASSENLRNANITEYMKHMKGERLRSNEALLIKLAETVKSERMKAVLEGIIDNTTSSYMLHIIKLRSGSDIPDLKYTNVLANERMYYYKSLTLGKIIWLETSEGVLVIADSTTAIDPLGDRDRFKVLASRLILKKSLKTKKLIGKLIFKNMGCDDERTLYMWYDGDYRRKYPVIVKSQPDEWLDDEPVLLTLHGLTNAISEKEAEEQINAVLNCTKKGDRNPDGSDIAGVDDIRGVLFNFVHRILGKPYWRNGKQEDYGWGAARNSGHPRCVIEADGDKLMIAEILGLQSNKHNTNFDKCDNMIHHFLFSIFGIVIRQYTNCTLNGSHNPITKDGKTTPWNLDELTDHILKISKPKKVPVVATIGEGNVLNYMSGSGSGSGSGFPSPVTTGTEASMDTVPDSLIVSRVANTIIDSTIHMEHDATHIIVKANGEEMLRIPYKGEPMVQISRYETMVKRWVIEMRSL